MEKDEKRFRRCWAIVELFGHNKIAGEISEEIIAGGTFLRVDVPQTEGESAFTKFYGSSAIYSITPVGKEIAKQAVKDFAIRPVIVWISPKNILSLPGVESADENEEGLPF